MKPPGGGVGFLLLGCHRQSVGVGGRPLRRLVALPTLKSQLEQASNALELATNLGIVCLLKGADLRRAMTKEGPAEEVRRLEHFAARVDPADWLKAIARPASFRRLLGDGFVGQYELVRAYPGLEYLGILRGLCGRVLPHVFEATEARITLRRGMPIPYAVRPIKQPMGLTPSRDTLGNSQLLEGLGFSLFNHEAGGEIEVVLDYGHRERLDDVTWRDNERLPTIASIHPADGGPVRIGTQDETSFFDVSPANWDQDSILGLLKTVSDVGIAVLPELSMPTADAIESALATSPDSYPALIVAGSAHQRADEGGQERRSNEARIYLDGLPVASHRKCHAYRAKELNGETFPQPLVEGITREPKTITILSGAHTRLGVVICADLNDDSIPRLLTDAGVNLLLVPSRSPSFGAFNGAITAIASQCQGVSVIANPRPDDYANGTTEPFLVGIGVPRAKPTEQSAEIPLPDDPTLEIAIIDSNEPASSAVTWR